MDIRKMPSGVFYEIPYETDYEKRCRFLISQEIAPWDVLAQCWIYPGLIIAILSMIR